MSTKIVSEARNIHGIILVLAAIMPAIAIISLVPVMPLLGREFAGVSGSEALVPLSRSLYLRYVSLFFRRWLAGSQTVLAEKCCYFSRYLDMP